MKWCPYKWPGFFIMFFGYTPTYRACFTPFITGSGAHLAEILGIFGKQILGTYRGFVKNCIWLRGAASAWKHHGGLLKQQQPVRRQGS